MNITHKVIEKNIRPFKFSLGTKTTVLITSPDMPADYNQIIGLATAAFFEEYGTETEMEDLFITIAFTTCDVIVEVSDAMRNE